jgi:hypothetical protein
VNVQGASLKTRGILVAIFFASGFSIARKAEPQTMCTVIDITTRERFEMPQSVRAGSVDTYRTSRGKIGIDACVPAHVAKAMGFSDALPGLVHRSHGDNGMIAFDARVSPAVADNMIETARRAGITIQEERAA